jgi:hypothetical protein
MPRPPLRIETRHEDQLVLLGCESCAVTSSLHTGDDDFPEIVQGFFDNHGGCASTIELS